VGGGEPDFGLIVHWINVIFLSCVLLLMGKMYKGFQSGRNEKCLVLSDRSRVLNMNI